MADWREAGIQIIASIIGTGLIVGIVTGIITEINRPHIDISINDNKDFDYTNNKTTFINTFTNIGNSPASDVRLTMYYSDWNISNYYVDQTSENLSLTFSKENPNTLVAYIPRFTNGAVITINTIINDEIRKESVYKPYSPDPRNIVYDTSSSIIATYNEGSDNYNVEVNTYTVFFIYAIIAVASFTVALKFKKISELIEDKINKNNQLKFVFQIYQDLITVKNNFTNDHQSVKYISTKKWQSAPSELKLQIFNSFDDYISIDKFYKELEKRNNRISESDFSSNYIVNNNKECANLANKSLTQINWTKYDLKKNYSDRILAIPLIIVGSLFILYIAEGIPWSLYENYVYITLGSLESSPDIELLGYSIPYNNILVGIAFFVTLSLTIIIRSIFSMLIAIQIEKISKVQQKDTAYDNEMLDSISATKYTKKRIFLISLLVVGFPTHFIMEILEEPIRTLNNELYYAHLYNLINVYDMTNPLTYPLTYILLDLTRMTILVWIIAKLHFKKIKKIYSNL